MLLFRALVRVPVLLATFVCSCTAFDAEKLEEIGENVRISSSLFGNDEGATASLLPHSNVPEFDQRDPVEGVPSFRALQLQYHAPSTELTLIRRQAEVEDELFSLIRIAAAGPRLEHVDVVLTELHLLAIAYSHRIASKGAVADDIRSRSPVLWKVSRQLNQALASTRTDSQHKDRIDISAALAHGFEAIQRTRHDLNWLETVVRRLRMDGEGDDELFETLQRFAAGRAGDVENVERRMTEVREGGQDSLPASGGRGEK